MLSLMVRVFIKVFLVALPASKACPYGSRNDSGHCRARTKALVLSSDQHHVNTKLMITKYGELWPDNPFIFYVPYNSVTRRTAQSRFEELLDVVNLTHTRYPIAETMLDLFDACGCREEIIFYAIDDRYPIGLNANILRQSSISVKSQRQYVI